MKINVLDNILNDESIIGLKELKNSIVGKVDSKKGRIIRPIPNINLLSDEVINVFTEKASDLYGKKLNLYAAAFGQYSKEFGIPKLPPHIDEVPSQFTIDYQLDSNLSWPIVIEGQEYILKNNSILTFEGEKVLHWRPKKEFKDGQYIDLIWFQFIDENHWSHTQDIRPDFKEYKNILMEKLKKWEDLYNEL